MLRHGLHITYASTAILNNELLVVSTRRGRFKATQTVRQGETDKERPEAAER
jgi:hypothetical protein